MTIQELQGCAEEYSLAPTPELRKVIEHGLEVVTLTSHAEHLVYASIRNLMFPPQPVVEKHVEVFDAATIRSMGEEMEDDA